MTGRNMNCFKSIVRSIAEIEGTAIAGDALAQRMGYTTRGSAFRAVKRAIDEVVVQFE